ncbi:acetyl-CoA carboxylase biotin carboxyl carrier protein [Ruminococcus sp. HUN007]|jgi:acetyl-CoA carboxylase biotin carboxyl carrier protein|uniref:acetyl-CoA carboxylase biotin carboxyl carrier protein n=1 Tax=Ruminococcus sp. HUN007 TaxID=1514668 RepID=UPI0005D20224|nr:acetyl-CoA carboxylase biotin carboxyl carrier protein [Ruminococcus sp. HUN007]
MADNRICSLTFAEIKELAELVSDKKLGRIEIKNGDSSILIEDKKLPPVPPVIPSASPVTAAVQTAAAPAVQNTETRPADEKITGNVVKAPIVGTFYASPSPDKPAFVKVGDHVKKGDVIFIVESMKLMNEIQSEFEGTVEQILVENASAVEYDQPIMIIK